MICRFWFAVLLLLAGCGGRDTGGLPEFPPSLEGGWTLARVEPIDAERTPPRVRELGLLEARRGVYQGPGELTLVVYQMTTPSAAFELAQVWQPSEGILAFPVGARFVLLQSGALDNRLLNDAAAGLEQLWSVR